MERHIELLKQLLIYHYNSMPGTKWNKIAETSKRYYIRVWLYYYLKDE